jgi:molybdenum cofactor synthesis domain-containing protein
MSSVNPKTAAIIIIGNEILTGKTRDKNAAYLIDELYRLGVALRRIVVVGDDPDEIAKSISECASCFSYVFTSGGVGPTHDDVTVEGVARAFGRQVRRHPELASIICTHFGEDVDEARMRMADVPEGSELIHGEGLRWPVLVTQNVYILPGVPQIFRSKFEAIRERFRTDPYYTSAIFTREDEFDLAPRLNRFAAARPDVQIGSYPTFGRDDYTVKITIEADKPDSVAQTKEELLKLLDPKRIVRTD